MPMNIAHTREADGREVFYTSDYCLKEDVKKGVDSDIEVLAVYRVEIPLENEQMLNVLRAIDNTTNTCLIQDLLALIFESGYRAGKAAM